jgi:hypothetical protein
VELEKDGIYEGLRMGVALGLGVTLTGEALEITPTEATVEEAAVVAASAVVVAAAAVVVAATEAAVVVESEEEAAPVYRAGPGMV